MIEGLLFSALGFLVAMGLAMAIAPALWRRAEHLERRRIEAALPLTREELEGEIDAVRAESAMAIRRLEVKGDALRKKSAADLVNINVLNDRVRDLEEECGTRDTNIERLEQEQKTVENKLSAREEELREQSARLSELTRSLADQMNEVQKLNRLNGELSMTSSTQKIDLVARETEIERLNNAISLLRTQRREADRIAREAKAEKVEVENALRLERGRVEDLQGRVERLLRDLSTRDHVLERQEKELAQYRPSPAAAVPALTTDASVADVPSVEENAASPAGPAEADEIAELHERIANLTAAHRNRRSRKGPEAEKNEQALREEISSIAAQMVRMVADREGPGSPVEQALSEPVREITGTDPQSRPESLADRVQKLRNAS